MRATVERSAFADTLKWVNGAVTNARLLPALSGVLVEAAEGKLRLTATDLDTTASGAMPASIEAPGRVLIPRRLAAAASKLPDAPVTLAVEGALTLTCGRVSLSAPLLDVDDFPSAPEVDEDPLDLPAGTLARVADVAQFVAKVTDKPALTGVNVQVGEGRARLAATDGYRAAVLDVEADGEGSCVVPAPVFAAGVAGKLSLGARHAQVASRSSSVTSALVEARYFRGLDDVATFAEQAQRTVTVERKELLDALGMAAAVGSMEARITVGEKGLVVEALPMAGGEGAAVALDATTSEAFAFHVHPPFLASVARAHDDGPVSLAQARDGTPVFVRSETPGLLTMVQPIKRKG